MLRAVLLGVGLGVVSFSVVGCKSDPETVKVAPGAPAGKVIELSGTVTSYGSGDVRIASRTLRAGDAIAGDETIETGSDGRISIELAHNLVRVDLPPNSHKKLTETLGWNAPRKNENAKPTDQDTSAAGRPAERAAANTPDTANADQKEEVPPTVQAAAPVTGVAPVTKGAGPASGDLKVESTRRSAPPPPPRGDTKKSATSGSLGGKDTRHEAAGGAGEGGGGNAAGKPHITAVEPPKAPPKVVATRGREESAKLSSSAEVMAAPAPDPASEGNALLDKHRAALLACLAHDSAATSFVVHVDAAGKVLLDRGNVKVKASEFTCVQRVLGTITFPHAKVDLTLDLKKP